MVCSFALLFCAWNRRRPWRPSLGGSRSLCNRAFGFQRKLWVGATIESGPESPCQAAFPPAHKRRDHVRVGRHSTAAS